MHNLARAPSMISAAGCSGDASGGKKMSRRVLRLLEEDGGGGVGGL